MLGGAEGRVRLVARLLATAGFAVFGIAAAVAAGEIAPVDGQQGDGQHGDGQHGELSLEEIVVTSDRKSSFSADLVQASSFRGARQLDTPLTVAVVPLQVMESQQAHGLYDALRN